MPNWIPATRTTAGHYDDDTFDARTPCQKHDAEIVRVAAQVDLVAEVSRFILSELTALRDRVATLEAQFDYFPIAGVIQSDRKLPQPPEVT